MHPKTLSFSHRGNLGDIIYSLPAVRACCTEHGCAADIVLVHDAPAFSMDHPFGATSMPHQAAKMLAPMLQHLNFVNTVKLVHNRDFQNSTVTYCLDDFRDMPDVNYYAGNIADWFLHLFKKYYQEEIYVDLNQPWIDVPASGLVEGHIGVCRSNRYRNDEIDYSPLQVFGSKLIFFGLEEEFKSFQRMCPAATYMKFNDFYSLAKCMRSCKAFFANQTFMFSLAESMKIKRYLEVCLKVPNVQPMGNGSKIMNQKDFEFAVSEILNLK